MPPELTTDSTYWIFSSAAQSIAGLIGFLMAGVTLAFSMMDRLADEDDTLREVIHALKTKYHRGMAILAVATGAAITTSLLTLYLNPVPSTLRSGSIFVAALLDSGVICAAIWFVISVASPTRYTRAAQSEYNKQLKEVPSVQIFEPAQAFFHHFIALENDIRTYLKTHDLYIPSRGGAHMSFSFRQMIDALYQNERISTRLRDKLLGVNKTRNLLFHGHIKQVADKDIQDLQNAQEMWEREKR